MSDTNYKRPEVSKLSLAFLQIRTLLSLSTRLITSPFKGSNGGSTYFKDVMYQALRTSLYHQTLEQNRYMNPPTTDTYLQVCKQRNFQPDTITLASGVKAHWFGKRKAEKLIIYFHGGGYTTPAVPGQIQYGFNFIESINNPVLNATMIFLAYDCAPEYTYPHQLRQGVELVNHMITNEGWDPSNILLAGDSAGGNLSLAIISHVLHPHPSVAPLEISKPFHAAVLISPWVSFDTSIPSFKRNAQRDMFYGRTLDLWSSAFLGDPSKADNYSEPIRAPSEWWNGAERVVEQVLIWGGEWEVLIDSIKEFAAKFEKGYKGKTTFLVTSRAIHDDMNIDRVIGIKEKGEAAQVLEGWVRAKL